MLSLTDIVKEPHDGKQGVGPFPLFQKTNELREQASIVFSPTGSFNSLRRKCAGQAGPG